VPTFAYEFNDDNAPLRFSPILIPPPVATHTSELQYLFDLQGVGPTLFPGTLDAAQEALAASMRAAWANFAASGSPATATVPWPAFGGSGGAQMLSLVPLRSQVTTDFAAAHHCSFWAAG
jgi:para-nitrobenzyl esterase